MHANAMLMIAGVLAAGMFCQWFAWRVKLPAILPLLVAGFLAGPALGILHPQEALGDLFFPLVSLSVALILFEGALTLSWREVRSVATTVRNLITIGAAVTWFGSTLAARYLMDMPWDLSLLFGALIIVTGPTVIAPLLRNVRPTGKIASVLRWEGILIDPIGATVAVLVFDFIIAGVGANLMHTLQGLLWIIAAGTALGLAGGLVMYQMLSRYLIPDYLRDTSTLAAVLSVFALSNALAAESGLLAVTVMGVCLANTDLPNLRQIFYFKEKLSVLLISTLFILLAANITPEDLMLLDWRSFVVLAVVILVIRPLGVAISARGSELNYKERLFLSWVAPRGIVAAAVSSLFVFDLQASGYEAARIVGPMTFLIIVGTVLIQGGTAKWVARMLKVSEADPQGFLLMGGDRLVQELALILKNEGFVVQIIDSNPVHVTEARLRGLNAQHGNLLSDFIETQIELGGIGRLLALTANDEANALACKQFENEFGSSEVYQLPPSFSSRNGRNGNSPNSYHLGRRLFAKDATFQKLSQMVEDGAVIKKTPLTQQFTLESFYAQYANCQVIPLMAVKGKMVEIWTVGRPLQPIAGWTVISLVLEPAAPQPAPVDSAEQFEKLDETAEAVA